MARVQNLLSFSEQFDNAAWTKNNGSITPDVIANPFDGNVTADAFVEDETTSIRSVQRASAPTTQVGAADTFSIWVKAGSRSFVLLQMTSGTFGGAAVACFNLTTGAMLLGSDTAYASATPYPNGWWRLSMTPKLAGYIGNCIAYVATSLSTTASSYVGSNGSTSLYLFGGQAVQANWPGPYTPTAAQPVNNGNIRNVVATQQNGFLWSEDFSNAAWSKINCTATIPGQSDPFGGVGACRITDSVDGGAVAHYVRQNSLSTLSSSQRGSVSFYAKAGTKTWINISEAGSGNGAYFDLVNGVVGTQSPGIVGTITPVAGAPGWYRCTATYPANGVTGTSWVAYMASTGASVSYQGDGTGTVYLFGAQAVQANWAGPYCKTGATVVNNGPIRNVAPTVQNLLTNSDPVDLAHVGPNGNVTVAPFSWPSSLGLANAVVFGDNSLSRFAYQGFTGTIGRQYTLSVYVQMDDNSVPVSNGGAGSDLNATMNSITDIPFTFYPVGNNVYRAVATVVAPNTAVNFGVIKRNTYTAKTFKVSGFQLVQANWPGPYTKTGATAIDNGPIRNLPQ